MAFLSSYPQRLTRFLCLTTALFAILAPTGSHAKDSPKLSEREQLIRLVQLAEGYPISVEYPLCLTERVTSPGKGESSDFLREYLYLSYLVRTKQYKEARALLEKEPDRSKWPYRMRVMEVQLLREGRDVKPARARCEELIASAPQEADGYLILADVLQELGEAGASISTLEAGRKAAPRQLLILQTLHQAYGRQYRDTKTSGEQMKILDQIEEISAAIVQARPGIQAAPYIKVLAVIKKERGKQSEAAQLLRQLTLLEPRDVDNYIELSRLQRELGDAKDALETVRRATIADPNDAALVREVNKVLLKSGDSDALLNFYKPLAEEYPGRADIQMRYALVLLGYSKRREAAAVLRSSLDFQPDNKQGRLLLAGVESDLGNKDQACQDLDKFLAAAGRNRESLVQAIRLFLKFDAQEKAAACFAELSRLDPAYPGLRDLEFQITLLGKDKEKTVALLTKEIEAHPEQTNLCFLLAQTLSELKRLEEAAPILRKALEKAPAKDVPAIRGVLLAVLQDTGRFPEAVEQARAILAAEPSDWRTRLILLGLYLKTENAEKVRSEASSVLQQFPNEPEVRYETALVYWEVKDYDATEAALRKAIELKPDYAEAYNSLAYLLSELNRDLDQAVVLVQKALELKPGAGHIVDSLGWIYYKKGDYEKAVRALEEAAGTTNNDPVVLDHLGDAYLKVDRAADALARFKQALDRAPNPALTTSLKKKIEALGKP
jgi:tetratricopeptide (TPR) repeat protein